MVRIFLGLLLFGTFDFPAFAQSSSPNDSGYNPAMETVIGKLGVSLPVWRTRQKKPRNWDQVREQFQKLLMESLSAKSYFDVVAIEKGLNINSTATEIARLTREKEADGVITIENLGTMARVSIRNRVSGRILSAWTHPAPGVWSSKNIRLLTDIMVESIIKDVPYKGYVVFVKGRRAQLTLGRKHNIEKGTRLGVFDFTGDYPTFSSPKTIVGELVIEKTSKNFAIARITKRFAPIRKYQKVDLLIASEKPVQNLTAKHSDGFWVAGGVDFVLLDTMTPEKPNMELRKYRLTLTPFAHVAGGWDRIAGSLRMGSAENDSNSVSFLFATGSFEAFRNQLGDWSLPTSVGIDYETVTASKKENAVAPLTSSKSLSPFIEQVAHLGFSEASRFILLGRLNFPVQNSDEVNGSATSALGITVGGGLRVHLDRDLAIESKIESRFGTMSYEDGPIQEQRYTMGVQANWYF